MTVVMFKKQQHWLTVGNGKWTAVSCVQVWCFGDHATIHPPRSPPYADFVALQQHHLTSSFTTVTVTTGLCHFNDWCGHSSWEESLQHGLRSVSGSHWIISTAGWIVMKFHPDIHSDFLLEHRHEVVGCLEISQWQQDSMKSLQPANNLFLHERNFPKKRKLFLYLCLYR